MNMLRIILVLSRYFFPKSDSTHLNILISLELRGLITFLSGTTAEHFLEMK